MGRLSPRRPPALAAVLLGLLLVALLLALLSRPDTPPVGALKGHIPVDPGQGMGMVGGSVLPVPADLQPGQRLQLGIQLEDVRGLSLSTKTFHAQGLLRLAWGPELEDWMSQNRVEAQQLFHFVNTGLVGYGLLLLAPLFP